MSTALVLSAGGLWAAWEAGVWKALRERFMGGPSGGTTASPSAPMAVPQAPPAKEAGPANTAPAGKKLKLGKGCS